VLDSRLAIGQSAQVTLLAEAEYKATMSPGMKLLQPDDVSHPVLLGDYVRTIPEPDLLGHDSRGMR
jgi:hypothetical protein